MPKLTKRFVESIRPTGKDRVLWDDKMPGFGVRSYVVQYRNAQRRSRRLTIGKHGAVTAEGAREIARQILNEVHDRKDPRDPVAERRALIKAPTVNDLLDQYLVEHVQKRNRRRTQEEIERLVARHIRPQLGKHKVAA
jgi:Arm DNA-binding domain